jgi:hypothetical protein
MHVRMQRGCRLFGGVRVRSDNKRRTRRMLTATHGDGGDSLATVAGVPSARQAAAREVVCWLAALIATICRA